MNKIKYLMLITGIISCYFTNITHCVPDKVAVRNFKCELIFQVGSVALGCGAISYFFAADLYKNFKENNTIFCKQAICFTASSAASVGLIYVTYHMIKTELL